MTTRARRSSMPNVRPHIPILVAAVATLASPLAGLEVHDYDPGRHDRFIAGTFPGNPEPNPGLWVNDADFAGVGWSADDSRKSFALISPRHFVAANHFRPPTGSQILFLGPDGEVRSYTYEKFHNIQNEGGENTDLFIGELSEDIPKSHGIPFYAVLDKPEAELEGMEILVYGRGNDEPRVGRGEIAGFRDSFGGGGPPIQDGPLNDTRHYTFEYRENSAGTDDAYLEMGDSGSPSFIIFEGEPTVSGIHSALEDNSTPVQDRFTSFDSFILHYRDQFDAHMSNTGHQLTLVPGTDENDNDEDSSEDDTTLAITGITVADGSVILTIDNSSGDPYTVLRTHDLHSDEWEAVATDVTGDTWTGTVPDNTPKMFWRLERE